jgi:hypothetical protein
MGLRGNSNGNLTIRLFGPFEVRIDGLVPPDLHRREGERLLAYLTLQAGASVAYATLAQLFWPFEARANAGSQGDYPSTRQAVRFLRRALGGEAHRLTSPSKGTVSLDLAGADVDLVTFDRLVADDAVEAWQEAVALYRGPLLEGWTEPWVLEARARRLRSYERVLQRLTAQEPAVQAVMMPPPRAMGTAVVGGQDVAGAEGSIAVSDRTASSGQKISVLYKRNAEPDETVLWMLERELKAAGFHVFIDRHMEVGIAWAEEIERQIRASEAVIPLLSAASIASEMLEHEIETADQAAQSNDGRPRILPVRVAYEGALPERSALATLLDPLQCAFWRGPEDDAALVSAILRALRTPPAPRPERLRLEPVGGAVVLDSPFYIERPADARLRDAIARADTIVLVQGMRQMGKTSLLARGLQQARASGARVVLTDLKSLNETQLATPDALLFALATAIASQLDLDPPTRADWNPDAGANMNLELFLRRRVLSGFSERLVWAVDEVDRLFPCPFGADVFSLFRSWYNRRALDPAGPWSRLTLVMSYATEATLFITDVHTSPFNVGTRVPLEDLTPEQVTELNRRYGEPLRGAEERARFYRLVGGHPYLARRGLDVLARKETTLSALEEQIDGEGGPFGDHLRRLLAVVSRDADLTAALREVLQGHACPNLMSFYRLRSAGVLEGGAMDQARPRCRIYADYLTQHLL